MHDEHLPERAQDGDHLPVREEPNDRRRDLVRRRAEHLATSLAERDEQGDKDEIDLLAYWRVLVKRRWLILGIIAVVLALALVHTLMTPPTYRATATLEIKNQGIQVMQVRGMTPVDPYDPDFMQTQIHLLQSRSLAQRVAEDLNLPGSNIFQRIEPPSWLQRLRSLVAPGQRAHGAQSASLVTSGGPPRADPPSVSKSRADPAPVPTRGKGASLDAATSLVQGGLSIKPIRNTHLVHINYTSTSPAFSARVANDMASGFITASMDRQVGAASYASKYLKDQLEQLRAQLQDSEAALVKYAQKVDIVPSGKGTSLASQNLGDLNVQLATVQAQRIQAEARWDTVKDTHGTVLPQGMLKGSILPELQTRLTKLQGQYEENLKTFKPGYPAMVSLASQIKAVQHQVDATAMQIRASVKAQYDAAVTQETMLEQKLAKLRTAALDVDSRSIRYNLLKRDVDTNRQLYNAMLQRYKQITMAGGVRPSNIAIIDQAQVPSSRFAPSFKRNLTMGLLLGIFLGVGLALLLEYLDDTLKTPEDIEANLKLGVVGIVPKLAKQTPLQALRDPRSSFAESYRSVRTALQFSTSSGIPKSLLVTSTGPGEGKSTTALILARNLAQLGKRVLLIDADLRVSTLGKTLGMRSETGLSGLLSGTATLPQAILKTDDAHLDVILSGPLPPSPAELLAGAKLVSLLTIVTNTYDHVIIDSPPVLGIADAPILANVAMGTLMVVRAGVTRVKPSQAALKRLLAARARMVGGLLTQYDMRTSGYSYGGYYGYGAIARLSHGG